MCSAAAVFTELAKAPAKPVKWLCTQQRSTACALALSAHATSYQQTPLRCVTSMAMARPSSRADQQINLRQAWHAA